MLRKVKILNFTSYKDYLKAVEKDKKIESFVEVANMYRTILSMFIIFCIVKIYELISIECQILFTTIAILLLIGFIVLFLCSYIKQIGYIIKRIIQAKENKEAKMTIVKSFFVGNGDMFAIRHASDNFTIIDCYLTNDNKDNILRDIEVLCSGRNIHRFISAHPDEDHYWMLKKKF